MSSVLKRLSKIDNKTKYGVYGWIRKAEQELQLSHIPSSISDICILYYYQDEIFHIVSKQVKVSEDGRSITKIRGGWANTNYGITEIESNTNNIYRWDFNMKKLQSYHVMIGIMDSKYINPDSYFMNTGAKNCSYIQWGIGWTYETKNGSWPRSSANEDWMFQHDGDKVSMILDLSQSKLTFIINDKVTINAYDDIKKSDDIKYRMFVTMWNRDDCVEIVKCE